MERDALLAGLTQRQQKTSDELQFIVVVVTHGSGLERCDKLKFVKLFG